MTGRHARRATVAELLRRRPAPVQPGPRARRLQERREGVDVPLGELMRRPT